MLDESPLFVVKAVDGNDVARYWTGRMNGSWPEYLRNRDRAIRIRKAEAIAAVLQFNERTPTLSWSREAA